MKKIILFIFVVAIAKSSFASNGFVGELSLGHSNQEFGATEYSANIFSFDEKTNSYSFTGGYHFSQYVAAELGYQHYGEFTINFSDVSFAKLNPNAVKLGVKASLPVANGFVINGRLGIAIWDVDTKSNDSDPDSDINQLGGNGTDFYYGIGAEYKFNEKIFVGLNYSLLAMDWKLREGPPEPPLAVDFKNTIKNISVSLGMFF